MHSKRQTANKAWPVPRKGTKYVAVPSHNKKEGIPAITLLRDILKIAGTKKEARKILNDKKVSVNGRAVRDRNFSICPFDLVQIGSKAYEMKFSEKGKLELKESKRVHFIGKVIGKKLMKNKKIQLNLLYGKNIISEEKVRTGDSVVIENNKIIKIIPLEEKREISVISGKYKGKEGKIEKIEKGIAVILSKHGKLNVPLKSLFAIK